MRCGTRVVATDCGVRVGTVVGHVWGSGELMVQWDGMKGTASVGKQTSLQIVGFDPSKGDKRGVWRKKTILETWLTYSA